MRAHTLFACSLIVLGCDVETQKSVQYISPGDDTGEQSEPVDVDSDDTGGDDTGESGPADGDGDGVADDVDNCPDDANADQVDTDGDGESEGGDACEGDESSRGEDALGKFWWARKTVEDCANVLGVFCVDAQGVIEAGGARFVAGVNDDIKLGRFG